MVKMFKIWLYLGVLLAQLDVLLARSQYEIPQKIIDFGSDGPLQANVTWDEHSLFVNGKRQLIYSGEFHPFRLPVPSLWLDVLQKVRSLGFTAVSFYVDWALVEGKPGDVQLDGVFALGPFFAAAEQAGIYLIARPGPYINAEVAGGGFPGWMQRIRGQVRTAEGDFLSTTNLYVKTVCEIIAKAQITNGGPIILVQPENEYSHWSNGLSNDPVYFNYVKKQFRDAGVIVPLFSNDAGNDGNNAPGSAAPLDIYGHDGYPLGFDCSNPYFWSEGRLPTDWQQVHERQSPGTPYTVPEFQGGSFDPWGGPGFDKCVALTGADFERVFWKDLYSFHVTIFNVYMIYGGTNWGNIGHPDGYTSYDYGAVIAEDRSVVREKYSEAKLQAYFLAASPAYLTATPGLPKAGEYASTKDITVTPLKSSDTLFIVVRHTDYASTDVTSYSLSLANTKIGLLTLNNLVLHGRDSKVIVSNYDLCGYATLLYSTAEVLTVKRSAQEVVLVLYGDQDDSYQFSVDTMASAALLDGADIQISVNGDHTVVNFKAGPHDQVVRIGSLTVWMVARQSAYNFWVLDVADVDTGRPPYPGAVRNSIIMKGGYMMRTASLSGDTLHITGDINATTTIRIIAGVPKLLNELIFNGENIDDFAQDAHGVVSAVLHFKTPSFEIPDLSKQKWSRWDSLPEISHSYLDDNWVKADLGRTNNTSRGLTTPTSLYSGDYGFHTGTLVYRGHYNATGKEKTFSITAQGGRAFGFSVWLNAVFLGSFTGDPGVQTKELTFNLPDTKHERCVFTVVIDNMGYNENYVIGENWMVEPRGILDYNLDGRSKEEVQWKLTGNYGGEDYMDKTRGPLNEGGMWAERAGLHLPRSDQSLEYAGMAAPADLMDGISQPGIAWYSTRFKLDMPKGYDIPLAIELPPIDRSTSNAYRVQIYVNGWQFGKYVHHLGPQARYVVPEGIWDYHGENLLAISLWAMQEGGAKLNSIQLVNTSVVQTGYAGVETVRAPSWAPRPGVY